MSRRSAVRVLLASIFFSIIIILFTGISFLMDAPEPKKRIFSKTVIFPQAGSDTVFNQPWQIAEPQIDQNFENERRIYSNFSYSKGMGNQMFQVASLSSIAKQHQAKLVLPVSLLLRRSFKMDDSIFLWADDKHIDSKLKQLKEISKNIMECCTFYHIKLDFSKRKEAVVLGYLQSLSYFSERAKETKKMFELHDPVQTMASEFLQTAFIERSLRVGEARMRAGAVIGADEDIDLAGDPLDSNVFVIGVHVRRGIDIRLNERNKRHGHVAAPLEYYKRAMKAAAEGQEEVLYVICSDDISWVKNNFKEEEYGSVAYCPSRWREADMAILLRADALVLSTGTYSWWAGYLSTNADKVVDLSKKALEFPSLPKYWKKVIVESKISYVSD